MTDPVLGASGRLQLTTARDVAESELRYRVLQGRLAPGDRVNQVLLAEELGISRGPLREAIEGLASEGLLQIVRHKGAFVPAVDAVELHELYELRRALETYAVRAACAGRGRRSPEVLDRLRELTSTMVDDGRPYAPGQDFHRGLVALAGNQSLLRAWTDLHTRISLARARSARRPTRAREAPAEHGEIVEAVRNRQGARAAKLLDQHLQRSYESAAALLADEV